MKNTKTRALSATLQVCIAALMVGCSSGPTLPGTPNLYLQGDSTMERIAPDRQTAVVDLLYATDRDPNEADWSVKPYYDARRSDSLAVGRVAVEFGSDLTWDALMEESRSGKGKRVPVRVTNVEEQVRFPSSVSIPVFGPDGTLVPAPDFLEARAAAEQAVRDEIGRRLADAERKEVYVYAHGVGNSFEDPMCRMAEFWHYLGRPGVPVVYSWPSIKGGGLLRGYTYARESSEFTVYHLRQFLEAVASCPDVERIHILAHSRGTGVTLSVLRDIRLIYKNDPEAGKAELKLGNVILAAPDIDLQIAQQRLRPDGVMDILDRLTIYVTPGDKALNIAEFLFRSRTRLGAATSENLSEAQMLALKEGRLGVDPIEVKVSGLGSHGHTYWIDNPAVLSDIILIMRGDHDAGSPERPLLRSEAGTWKIHDGYPHEGVHADASQ